MEYQDKNLTCVDCSVAFVHSAADQARYAERGLGHEPKRCPNCRAKRRNKQEAGAGATTGERAGGPPPNRGRAGRFFSATQDNRGRREFFPATCAACGKETTVPFRPVEGRPVYCRDCFQAQRQ